MKPSNSPDKDMAKRLIRLLQNKDNGFDAVENRPISIPTATIRKICQAKHVENPTMVIGVYTFMYARGREEKTDKPWVNNEYIAKGLKLNPQTVAKYRKQLTELGLIRDTPLRKNGRIYKHVTHIRYYDGITIRDPQLIEFITTLCKSYTIEKLQGSSTIVSACSLLSEEESACKSVAGTKRARRRPPKPLDLHGSGKAKDSPQHKLSIALYEIVAPHLKGMPNQLPKKDPDTGQRDFRAWDREFHQLLEDVSFDDIAIAMEAFGKHWGMGYWPEIESARSFRLKYIKILSAMKRERQDAQRQRQKSGEESSEPEYEDWDRPKMSEEEKRASDEDEDLYNQDPVAWNAKYQEKLEAKHRREEKLDREYLRQERLREKREGKRK